MVPGIFIKNKESDEEAKDRFLKNCSCSLYNRNVKGGIIFLLHLNDKVESPYIDRQNQPVQTILLKMVFINDETQQNKWYFQSPEITLYKSIKFRCEVANQCSAFERSIEEPICPAIAYSTILKGGEKMDYLTDLLKKSVDKTKEIIESIKKNVGIFDIGFIYMEYLRDFDTLYDTKDFIYNVLAIYELYRLYQIGYIHGDPHRNNFLINPYYDRPIFAKPQECSVMIIDFGAAFLKPTVQTIPLDNIMKVVDINLDYPSEIWGKDFIPREWPSYYWLRFAAENKSLRSIYNTMLRDIAIRKMT